MPTPNSDNPQLPIYLPPEHPSAVFGKAFYEGLKPDPVLLVSEWADKHRVLTSDASAAPGRWNTNRTPYLREIMDSLSPSCPVTEVVFMKGSQIGGSECGINWIAYIMAQAPGPTLLVQPTVDLAKDFSKRRVETMIEATEAVKKKVKPDKERDKSSTILQKSFSGATLRMTGANSAAGLRSMPIKNLMMDEVDAYPGDLDGEGDPVMLATARTRTYSLRKKIFKVSSPKIAGSSRIEKDYNESDRRRYMVPCPHCDHRQEIKWANIKYDNDNPDTARLVCEGCREDIPEHFKDWMLARGEWVAQNPTARVRGYHLSALYSPLGWYTWAQAVREWIEAKGNATLLKTFVNTVLGETWAESGEAPEWERLYNQREDYKPNSIPPGAIVLTAGVDVQVDRLEFEVVGWGKNSESWSIDYRTLMGDPEEDAVWDELEKVIATETWETAHGTVINLKMVAVDTGFKTQRVYDRVRHLNKVCGERVLATKGMERAPAIIGRPRFLDVNYRGKAIKRGIALWPVGVDVAKTELYGRLKLERKPDGSYPRGYCHFPMHDEEYFKMLTGEEKRGRVVKGYKVFSWQKIRDRNEALDCRVYARAAAAQIGLDRWEDASFDYEAGQSLTAPADVGTEIERRKGNWLRR